MTIRIHPVVAVLIAGLIALVCLAKTVHEVIDHARDTVRGSVQRVDAEDDEESARDAELRAIRSGDRT